MIYFHMQRFKFIDFMVIELHLFKKKMAKMWKTDFMHVLHNRSTNFCILVIFFTLKVIKLKVKINKILMQSRTTVLCDMQGPNHIWHSDGYDKLSPFGLTINRCIDG